MFSSGGSCRALSRGAQFLRAASVEVSTLVPAGEQAKDLRGLAHSTEAPQPWHGEARRRRSGQPAAHYNKPCGDSKQSYSCNSFFALLHSLSTLGSRAVRRCLGACRFSAVSTACEVFTALASKTRAVTPAALKGAEFFRAARQIIQVLRALQNV